MRNHKTYMFLLGVFFGLFAGCKKWNEQEIYQRPHWLPGKLYTTVLVQENLSMFAECLRLTKLDTILDVSGVWSVFAPTDEAMRQFLSENQYASISDIPLDELERITEFHIIQNPWSFEQLQELGIHGWRPDDDENLSSFAYKRETMLKNPVEKYWIKREKNNEVIVADSTLSEGYKKVFVASRKYVPIIYDDFFAVNGLTSDDYRFYFGREYEHGNIYYAGAKILEADIFAENGYVHIIDKVVYPMRNAKEILERELPGESYKFFFELINWYYPTLSANMVATNSQPAARFGGIVDTIWNLNYYDLNFAPHEELTGVKGPGINETLVKHNGLFVPTDDVFRKFMDEILTAKSGFPHWPDYKSLPMDILDIIVEQHFRSVPLYPSSDDYSGIFRSKGRFKQNEENIIRKEFGSNCTFIGLDAYSPDRVFTSVTGPVFCRPSYSIFRLAMQYSGVHNTIANHDGELYFFPISDYALKKYQSMEVNWIDRDTYNFIAYDRFKQQMVVLNSNIIKNLILNHVGTHVSGDRSGKEVIRTLRGNYITWDHSDNTIQGSRPSTEGYDGDIEVTNTPVRLNGPADNGEVWSVSYWFNF